MAQRKEICESGCPERVTNHDADGVPLCKACWEQLKRDWDELPDELRAAKAEVRG